MVWVELADVVKQGFGSSSRWLDRVKQVVVHVVEAEAIAGGYGPS